MINTINKNNIFFLKELENTNILIDLDNNKNNIRISIKTFNRITKKEKQGVYTLEHKRRRSLNQLKTINKTLLSFNRIEDIKTYLDNNYKKGC